MTTRYHGSWAEPLMLHANWSSQGGRELTALINGRRYSQQQAKTAVARILALSQLNQPARNQAFLISLLSMHPHAATKLRDLDYIFMRLNSHWKTKELTVQRKDGSCVGISYSMCIHGVPGPTHWFVKACSQLAGCEMTVIFSRIALDFLAAIKIDVNKVEYEEEAEGDWGRCVFKDGNLAFAFQQFFAGDRKEMVKN